MTFKCEYCGSEAKQIEKYSFKGECSNKKCGGYFELIPKWSMNEDWNEETNKGERHDQTRSNSIKE